MDVALSPELEREVQERVARGDYDSPEALVRAAVQRLLIDEDIDVDPIDEIRAKVEAAEREIDRGEFTEYGFDEMDRLVQDVHKRGVERLRRE